MFRPYGRGAAVLVAALALATPLSLHPGSGMPGAVLSAALVAGSALAARATPQAAPGRG
jgi:hypothetical protein